MDIGTHAYSTECHFFRDSAQAGTIEWREALPNAEPLPFNSGIVNLDWELDKDWIQQPYGEIWGAPRTFNPARPPIGLRGVPCGSVRDFQIGAIYDDERVPIQYTKFGYPLCCGAVVGMRGGAGASGLSVVATNTFIDPTEGGVDLGGEAGDVAAYADATEGGVELGGEAGDVYTAPTTPLPPGSTDCATPTLLAPGVTYAGVVNDAGSFVWYAVTPSYSGDWHMVTSGTAPSTIERYLFYQAMPCESTGTVHSSVDGCLDITVPSGNTLALVLLSTASGLSITLRVDAGVCPVAYADATEGGLELGGEAGDVVAYADATEGGVELGGEAGDVFTPGTPAPGSDCASAPSLAPGVTYAWTGPTDGSVEQWWSWVIPIAGTYRITGTGFSTGTVIGHGLYGSGCDHIFGDMGLLGVLDCMNATLGAGSVVYLVVSGSSGTPYTFVLEEGSC